MALPIAISSPRGFVVALISYITTSFIERVKMCWTALYFSSGFNSRDGSIEITKAGLIELF
jgi:hypothetical protein